MKNFAVEGAMRFLEELMKIPVGQEATIVRTKKGFSLKPISAKTKPINELLKPYLDEGYELITNKEGWICDPNGNEAEAVPVREENGEIWIGDVKVLTDSDPDYMGVELSDGTVIPKIIQAPKKVTLGGAFFDLLSEYQKSEKYRQVLEDGVLLVTHNLSKDGDKVQSIESNANNPIVSEDYPDSMELASKVGYGNIASELLHDTEYSFWWIYKIYVQKDEEAVKNEYYLWLQTITNESSERVLARSILNNYEEVGTRGWGHFSNYSNGVTFRSSLKRSTVH